LGAGRKTKQQLLTEQSGKKKGEGKRGVGKREEKGKKDADGSEHLVEDRGTLKKERDLVQS